MTKFAILLILGFVFLLAAFWLRVKEFRAERGAAPVKIPSFILSFIGFIGLALIGWAVLSTSYVDITPGHTGHLTYRWGTSRSADQVVSTNGGGGYQGNVLGAGMKWQAIINIRYEVTEKPFFQVPENMCAMLSARAGPSIPNGQRFADPWEPDVEPGKMLTDAEYFFSHGGKKGDQSTVLPPGSWPINEFLWGHPMLVPATIVSAGFVASVNSSVVGPVNFGAIKAPLPKDLTPITVRRVLGTPAEGGGSAVECSLVPLGGYGVWATPITPGSYFVNTNCYQFHPFSIQAQSFECKGGYSERTIDLVADEKGQVTQQTANVEVKKPEDALSDAISLTVEGWPIFIEMRGLVQVRPENVPFVSQTLGTLEAVDSKIVVPAIRSGMRTVGSGGRINARADDVSTNSTTTHTNLATVNRRIKPEDFIYEREQIEKAVEAYVRPQAEAAGVEIIQIRIAKVVFPPELLLGQKLKQLAENLRDAWTKQQEAQVERQKKEKAKSIADQQMTLVEAEMKNQAATNIAAALRIQGQGEADKIKAIAEAQKEQLAVLGEQATVQLAMFDKFVAALKENPTLLSDALKVVERLTPNTLIVNGGADGNNSLSSAASIFGTLFNRTGAGGVSGAGGKTNSVAKP